MVATSRPGDRPHGQRFTFTRQPVLVGFVYEFTT